jgi:iron(III) transport system substrate-binding protein
MPSRRSLSSGHRWPVSAPSPDRSASPHDHDALGDGHAGTPASPRAGRLARRSWLATLAGGLASTGLVSSGLVASGLVSSGCWRAVANEVVVYASLDREFSAPHLTRFERATGISVAPKYDVESTKTVGLANAILLERARPVCDLFWNNEILHTLRLARAGVLQPYRPPLAEHFPAMFRDPEGLWHGFAARARVLLVNTRLVPEPDRPRSVSALADPRWKGKAGIAKPLFGTTATHAAVLFATWGRARATAFFQQVLENAETLSGNKHVATAVGRGQIAWGVTDTDDAIAEVENGSPVAIVYPDPDTGTLLIPNTLAIIRDCRHPERARRLVDYLLRPEVERELAAGPSAQFPLSDEVAERPRVEPTPAPKWMEVDFHAAAEEWETASRVLRDLYER